MEKKLCWRPPSIERIEKTFSDKALTVLSLRYPQLLEGGTVAVDYDEFNKLVRILDGLTLHKDAQILADAVKHHNSIVLYYGIDD